MDLQTTILAARSGNVLPSFERVSYPLAIFAVGDDKADAFERDMTFAGLKLKRVVGAYKGQTEVSFVTPLDTLYAATASGWLDGQESILVLSSRPLVEGRVAGWRDAALLFLLPDGRPDPQKPAVPLGRFVAANQATALAQDAWTFDPSEDMYYVTREA